MSSTATPAYQATDTYLAYLAAAERCTEVFASSPSITAETYTYTSRRGQARTINLIRVTGATVTAVEDGLYGAQIITITADCTEFQAHYDRGTPEPVDAEPGDKVDVVLSDAGPNGVRDVFRHQLTIR